MSTKVVVFDFDGVFVLDSDAVFKKEAWGVVLERWAGRYEPLLAEGVHLYGSGKPGGRIEILRYVFERLSEPADNIAVLVAEAANKFDEHVQTRIRDAGLVPGAREMLEQFSNRGASLYLNSGTATSALCRSTRNLQIDHFFAEILGSTMEPVGGSKVENLQRIAEQEGAEPGAIFFIGDGNSDRDAAKIFGCRFVGVANRWNRWDEGGQAFPVITDLRTLPRLC